MIADTAVLLLRDTPVQPGNGYAVAGDILAHETDRNTGREFIPNPGEQAQAFRSETRQDQMTDQGALEHDAVFIVNGSTGLAAHLLNRGGGDSKIVRRCGAQPSGTGGEMLQVRKVYVNDAFETAQGIHGFIAGGIPYQGQRRTPEFQRLQDPGNKRGACDKRQGVDTQVCQALERV